MTNSALRFDYISVSPAKETDEGYLTASSVVSRAGVFIYHDSQGNEIRELRHPDYVFNQESLDTIKLKPITLDHPQGELVDSTNFKDYVVGYTGEDVQVDGENIVANFVINDKTAVDKVLSREITQLSLGYTVELIPESGEYNGEPYDFIQTNLQYNHLALVRKARAGSVARIHLDAENELTSIIEDKSISFDNGEIMHEDLKTDEHAKHENAEHTEQVRSDEKHEKDENGGSEGGDLAKQVKELKKALEAMTAERDALKDKLDEMENKSRSDDSVESLVSNEVAKRLKLIDEAKRIDADADVRFDSMDSISIKRKILESKIDGLDLSAKSDAYIEARWDLKLEDTVKRDQSVAKQREQAVGLAKNDTASGDADSARKQMVARIFSKEA